MTTTTTGPKFGKLTPPPNGLRAPAPLSLLSKIDAMIGRVEAQVVGRGDVVRGLVLAALAQENAVLVGPPGTAKSMLTRAFVDAFEGASYFEHLLTRFTTPDELFGPWKLTALQRDVFERETAGRLPTAHVAFLDEVFKANSASLNSLLAVLNERVFHDAGRSIPLPLRMVVGASNEYPTADETSALWDRFVVRFHVDYLANDSQKREMLCSTLARRPVHATAGKITIAEWDGAVAAADAVVVADDTIDAVIGIARALTDSHRIKISDRKLVKAAKIVKANAFLRGLDTASPDECDALVDVLWNDPKQRELVAKIVMARMSPEVAIAKERIKGVEELVAVARASHDANDYVAAFRAVGIAGRDVLAQQKNARGTTHARLGAVLEGLRALKTEVKRSIDGLTPDEVE